MDETWWNLSSEIVMGFWIVYNSVYDSQVDAGPPAHKRLVTAVDHMPRSGDKKVMMWKCVFNPQEYYNKTKIKWIFKDRIYR